MPVFSVDPASGQAILHLRKGGQIARQATVNGNTAFYDINGVMIEYRIANPRGASGIMLNGLPEAEACREMMKHHSGWRTTGA